MIEDLILNFNLDNTKNRSLLPVASCNYYALFVQERHNPAKKLKGWEKCL